MIKKLTKISKVSYESAPSLGLAESLLENHMEAEGAREGQAFSLESLHQLAAH